jgi:hypothetical protein
MLQTPLAVADQDGGSGEGEGGEHFKPVAADASWLQTERAESPNDNSPGQAKRRPWGNEQYEFKL